MNNYNRIRSARKDRDLKQKDIARILEISQQYYSKYETGEIEMPIRHYKKLAKKYDLSIDYLEGLIEEEKPLTKRTETKLSPRLKKLIEAYITKTEFKQAIDKLLDIK